MNATDWLDITQVAILPENLVLQNSTLAQLVQSNLPASGFLAGFGISIGPYILNLIAAIAILIVGWIVAAVAASVTRGILNRTNIDNRIAGWIAGRSDAGNNLPVEQWASSAVFWLIIVFTVVAFLEQLQLKAVTQPLNGFLNQVTEFLPKLIGAGILLGVAWGLATIAKMVTTRSLHAFGLDQRLHEQVSRTPEERPLLLSETIGTALYWFIFLLFLPAVLNTLGLQGTLQPVQQLLNNILSIVPNILAAVLVGAAGWLIAQLVRRIITNLLSATGTDQLGAKFGLSRSARGQSLSWIIGTIVYVLILIPTAIAALNLLRIDAISQPAIAMLNQILNALPKIFTAGLILVLAYVLGRFVADLVTSILTGVGFDNIFNVLGISSLRKPVAPPTTAPRVTVLPLDPDDIPTSGQARTTIQSSLPTRTPSELIGIVILVGIMLFGTLAAVNVLDIAALTALIGGLVVVSGRILAGLVVFAIGLYLANLAFNLITSSGDRQALILGQVARIAIIAFVSAMALQQMGIASDIINLAFGLLLGAVAVAVALAFGLGGRDIAAGQIRETLNSFKQKRD